MYPAPFEYARPASLDEAIALLAADHGEARLLAGGHSLLPLMKLRLAEPTRLIDIGRLDDLRYIRVEGGEVAIGALTTHHALETSDPLRRVAPVVAEAAAEIGDTQVRNRGTIGGSLAHADPGADLPAVMLALGARMVARGPGGVRAIPAEAFFADLLTTDLRPDEILVEVRFAASPPGSGAAYRKFEHPASGYAIAGVAAWLRLEGGTVAEARVGVTGVASTAFRATGVEQALVGGPAQAATFQAAAAHAMAGRAAAGDLHASPEYRAHLARVLTHEALEAAAARARG